jgi:osmotically-inducible protein OsmY
LSTVLFRQRVTKGNTFASNRVEAAMTLDVQDVTLAARERLRRSPYMPIRTLSCDYEHGVLLLRGRLSSFYHKQIAQETVSDIEGVLHVVNEIEVIA